MTSTYGPRRPVKPRLAPKTVISIEKLSEQFSSGLTVSEGKGKQKVASLSEGETRLASMRAVNSASQALSTVVQSGWKTSSGKHSTMAASAISSSTTAAKHLAVLRQMGSGDIDIERAAMSVLGKLVALEMYDEALTALDELHPRICLSHDTPSPTSSSGRFHLLSIPLPSLDKAQDPTLLILTITYLAYALAIMTNYCFSSTQKPKDSTSNIDALSEVLCSTEPTFMTWVVRCSVLPAKQLDSNLTRVYTILTKACASSKRNDRAIFSLRMYAMTCLAHATLGTIEPGTYWDQVVRFTGAFGKSQSSPEQDMIQIVQAAFLTLVGRIEAQSDGRGFLDGKGFIGFCECWMAFAKKTGDICLVDRIAGLLQGISMASSSSSKPDIGLVPDSNVASKDMQKKLRSSVDMDTLEAARLCATFAQTTAALEQSSPDMDKRVQEATAALKASDDVYRFLQCHNADDPDYVRIYGKVDRALERLRRATISFLNASTTPPGGESPSGELLEEIARSLQRQCALLSSDADVFTRTLDTQFVLARTRLVLSDPRTYIPVHDALSKANELVQHRITDHSIDCPNYLRCISGAFHNIAGTLYQADRHGSTLGFLKDACTLGTQALELRKKGFVVSGVNGSGKTEEGWKKLEEQLYRRWELLGVCHSKIGDRKQALSAFRHCIETFPYSASGFSEKSTQIGATSLFNLSAGTKQLGALIDQVTTLSASELLMDPSAVSLMELNINNASITGALMERQIESLELNKWKAGVVPLISHLLKDTLKVYGSEMPIRRARILVKCLDFMYHSGPSAVDGYDNPEDIGDEVVNLLQGENFGQDSGFARSSVQYRAETYVWLALHAHRRADPKQNKLIADHTGEACRLLRLAASSSVSEPRSEKKSPKPVIPPKKPAIRPTARQRSTRRAPAPPEPVTPRPKTRKVLQPISLNVKTPPRQKQAGTSLVVFDDFEKLSSLLLLAARICGLLALTLSKVQLLDVSRRLCDLQLGKQSDGFVISSVDLANEYIKIGKIRRAATIFSRASDAARAAGVSDEARTYLFLRHAEFLAKVDDISGSSAVYREALSLSDAFVAEEKGLPTILRVRMRVVRLEKAAIASYVFALIQYAKDDVPAALDGLLQSLRLWNRATETLSRLNTPPVTPPTPKGDNPFQMSSLKDALPTEPSASGSKEPSSPRAASSRRTMDGLEWRVSEGLLTTIFALNQIYLDRGSAREAEYFAQQAQDLAESLNAPTMVSRALAKKGEIRLYQGDLETSMECLTKAAALLENTPGMENIDVRRLRGMHNERMAQQESAIELYEESLGLIEELDQTFKQFDSLVFSRKSIGSSPGSKGAKEVVLPELLAAVLRQRIWLLRDSGAQNYSTFLDKFLSLPPSPHTKAKGDTLMAKLTLHAVYASFRADMFLSSLTESTIALPMGMSSKIPIPPVPATQDILVTLEGAEKLFWENLTQNARRGSVSDLRDSVVSLALVQAFRTSLGKSGTHTPALVGSLLDASTAITLRREMLEAIQHKFPAEIGDDVKWPLIGPDGSPKPRPSLRSRGSAQFTLNSPPNSDDDDEPDEAEGALKGYWASIRKRYQDQTLDSSSLSAAQVAGLPPNWTIVHISVTEDKETLFVTRQECGDSARTPLVFCVPLKGRRDNGSGTDEEEHLTFEDAIEELKEIVRLSDEGTKAAVHVKAGDQEARSAWWKERGALDTRLRELLENIEFCWLGAFKTILNPRSTLTPELISDLRTQFNKVFHRGLHLQDKKIKQRTAAHKKGTSQSQNLALSQVTFDDSFLECFSTLSPKCRDEELEDLAYFILDLYQFHGVPVAIAEVDIIQVVLDLRAVLEDHAQKLPSRQSHKTDDEHMFLVLDKNLQGLPWESFPILRGRSVSRIPSVDFLHDRILFAQSKRRTLGIDNTVPVKGAVVNPHKGYYILNPSGDLSKTEGRFKDWASDMEKAGWEGITGSPPSEQQFLNALRNEDLVVYFGHGGGEQYLRSHKIRNLPTCAATMLWGCSSGALREMGDFDRVGTPYNYMLAGCPCLVANLWDVTDRDIDKFSQTVFDKLGLTASGIKRWGRQDGQISIVDVVAQSRDSCKLKYLTGAAPVVYGIPFYL